MCYRSFVRHGLRAIPFAVMAAGLLSTGLRCTAQGVGDLLIAPTRIVFEGSKRTAEVNLINVGDKQATYRISLIHQRMNEDGKLEEIQTPGPGERFADELVRFTPRQVVLEPHGSQLVRLQLRLPAELETGEYRSHLLFRAVPVADAPADPAAPGAETTPKGLSIRITPIYGVSIPLIVRHGNTSAFAALANLKLETGADGAPMLTGRLNRTGNCSMYGDLQVVFAPAGSRLRPVARAGGVAVYIPNAGRNFTLRLAPQEGLELRHGTLRVSYRQPPSDGDAVLTEATLTLP